MSDTIYAPATLVGRAGLSAVRISGPGAGAAVTALAGRLPPPRRASLCRLRDPATGEAIDRGLVLWFPAPASFTGEDMAELHLHGGRAVIAAVLHALEALPGLRLAEPGEFARRAFDNGKLDLTAVEGLADLVAAETEAQRRQALRQLEGGLGDLTQAWRERLVTTLARLEAAIDFPEEGLPEGLVEETRAAAEALADDIAPHLDDTRGERLRDGALIVILGPPNVGKSSLLNYLAKRDAAIVSTQAGTTRDVVEVHLDLAGYPATVADTAGLREASDPVEREGVARALDRADRADLKLLMVEATAPGGTELGPMVDGRTLVLVNKIDLLAGRRLPELLWPSLPISMVSGVGLDRLSEELTARVRALFEEGGPAPVVTRARHRAALADCVEALRRAGAVAAPELIAEDLRLAARALGRVTGQVDVEELLDRIFRDFCIGK